MASNSENLKIFLSKMINELTENQYYGEVILCFKDGVCHTVKKIETIALPRTVEEPKAGSQD